MTGPPGTSHPIVRRMGLSDYQETWRAMRDFVDNRGPQAADEIWLLQHPPVYTRGLNCSMDPLPSNTVPVVQTDRGGQITYHGPGQLIAYTMLDIRRRHIGVKRLVNLLEQSVIDLLSDHGIAGERIEKAPGVYVDGRKIAALGVRIRRGCSYHGLSLNVDMDLSPFDAIHPCGYEGLEVTQLHDLGVRQSIESTEEALAGKLLALLPAGPPAG